MSLRVTFLGSGDAFGSGGRLQTCILVDGPGQRLVLDYGTSSLSAMRAQGVDPNGIDVVELRVGRTNRLGDLAVTPREAVHTPGTNPTALRVDWGGRTVTYPGDSDWTEELIPAARDADLLIAECYVFEKRIPYHMTYTTLAAHLGELGARRVVLTHMHDDMLARTADVPEACAFDGLLLGV